MAMSQASCAGSVRDFDEAVFWAAWPHIAAWRVADTRARMAVINGNKALLSRMFKGWVVAAAIFPPPLVESTSEDSEGEYVRLYMTYMIDWYPRVRPYRRRNM